MQFCLLSSFEIYSKFFVELLKSLTWSSAWRADLRKIDDISIKDHARISKKSVTSRTIERVPFLSVKHLKIQLQKFIMILTVVVAILVMNLRRNFQVCCQMRKKSMTHKSLLTKGDPKRKLLIARSWVLVGDESWKHNKIKTIRSERDKCSHSLERFNPLNFDFFSFRIWSDFLMHFEISYLAMVKFFFSRSIC